MHESTDIFSEFRVYLHDALRDILQVFHHAFIPEVVGEQLSPLAAMIEMMKMMKMIKMIKYELLSDHSTDLLIIISFNQHQK